MKKFKHYCCLAIKQYLEFEHSYLKNKDESINRKFLLRGLTISLIILIGVMLLPPAEYILMYFTGADNKLELLKFIGLGISGIIAVFGVVGILQRSAALDKQNKMTEDSHVQERFKVAAEHLGHTSMSVRIAAFSTFCYLVEIKPDWQKNIFDVLCAHVRQITRHEDYQQDKTESEKIKPSVEIHNLLDILFKSQNSLLFDGLTANLRGAILQGASLERVNLQKADMYNVNLQDAYLRRINLQDAYLYRANLQHTTLQDANLQNARMWRVNLKNANLKMANLCGVDLRRADLQNADLQDANLQDAEITKETIATMPDGWKDMVKKDENGKTGVKIVDNEKNFIERI